MTRLSLAELPLVFIPVPEPQLFEPLEEPAVEQHARAVDIEQVFRTRDGTRRSQKGQLGHG